MAGKKRKVRVQFRKNRERKRRKNDLTRDLAMSEDHDSDALVKEERVSGKGDLSRYRTVMTDGSDDEPLRAADGEDWLLGRVVQSVGLNTIVETESGQRYECTVRRVLRTMARDERNAIVVGDRVLFQIVNEEQGVIERVEPRHGVLSRQSARREHIIVSNIDQIVIIVSAVEPALKPHLIDRFIVSAEKGEVRAVIVVNKMDLVEPGDLEPVFGIYSRLGYELHPVSAQTGQGIGRLRSTLQDKQSVVTGQSGVGKSSLLNRVDPALKLQTGEVSGFSSKGRHTTRRAELLHLPGGGWVADTPGIRQLELWNVDPAEMEAYFIEFHALVPFCKFPDCTHTHEASCGVKQGVDAGLVHPARYQSYVKLFTGE